MYLAIIFINTIQDCHIYKTVCNWQHTFFNMHFHYIHITEGICKQTNNQTHTHTHSWTGVTLYALLPLPCLAHKKKHWIHQQFIVLHSIQSDTSLGRGGGLIISHCTKLVSSSTPSVPTGTPTVWVHTWPCDTGHQSGPSRCRREPWATPLWWHQTENSCPQMVGSHSVTYNIQTWTAING